MFDAKQTEAFRSIAAPEELRQRVLAMEGREQLRRKRIMMSVCSAAACLLLIVAVPLLTQRTKRTPVYKVSGFTLADEAIPLEGEDAAVMTASVRASQEFTAVFSAEFPCETELTLSEGSLELLDPESGEVIASGMKCIAEDDVTIRWTVDASEDAQHVLTVDSDGTIRTLWLYYDPELDTWLIRQTADAPLQTNKN